MDIVSLFDSYVKCGMKPLPLIPGTKIPFVRDWQMEWSVEKYRNIFISNPDANIGVLLGNIIDVEGDDTFANELISELTRNTPHPTFKSSKSVHHLFISPDPTITICKIGAIEFRGHRHQSVIPPSTHVSGVEYKWLKGSTFPPPHMPQRLIDFLYTHKKSIRNEKILVNGKKSNHVETFCNKCRKKNFLHKKRLVLEVRAFSILGQKWQCQKCRTVDVRALCRQVRNQRSQDL